MGTLRQAMTVVFATAVALGAGVAVGAGANGSGQTPTEARYDVGPTQNPDEFIERGDAAIATLCAKVCHNAEKVFEIRRSAREWTQIIVDMTRRGAKGTDEDRDLVRRYLTWSFGEVKVNTSNADDLAAVIGLPMATAEAIVSHRQRHGRFADVNALAQVEGVDKAILEAQIDALRFD